MPNDLAIGLTRFSDIIIYLEISLIFFSDIANYITKSFSDIVKSLSDIPRNNVQSFSYIDNSCSDITLSFSDIANYMKGYSYRI